MLYFLLVLFIVDSFYRGSFSPYFVYAYEVRRAHSVLILMTALLVTSHRVAYAVLSAHSSALSHIFYGEVARPL
jgi:hypothetical protein